MSDPELFICPDMTVTGQLFRHLTCGFCLARPALPKPCVACLMDASSLAEPAHTWRPVWRCAHAGSGWALSMPVWGHRFTCAWLPRSPVHPQAQVLVGLFCKKSMSRLLHCAIRPSKFGNHLADKESGLAMTCEWWQPLRRRRCGHHGFFCAASFTLKNSMRRASVNTRQKTM